MLLMALRHCPDVAKKRCPIITWRLPLFQIFRLPIILYNNIRFVNKKFGFYFKLYGNIPVVRIPTTSPRFGFAVSEEVF